MRLIKGFLLAIAGLFIMITLLSLLIPSKVMVVRGVAINANAKKVFAELNNLRNWQHWQPVFKNDSLKMDFSPDSTGVNSFCKWENRGKINKLSITALGEYEVTVALSRDGENDVMNTITILPLPDSNSVQVEWKALTKLKWYPWEKFYGIFIEKITGQSYEDALNSLKAYAESH
jgi:hypothetical protein